MPASGATGKRLDSAPTDDRGQLTVTLDVEYDDKQHDVRLVWKRVRDDIVIRVHDHPSGLSDLFLGRVLHKDPQLDHWHVHSRDRRVRFGDGASPFHKDVRVVVRGIRGRHP